MTPACTDVVTIVGSNGLARLFLGDAYAIRPTLGWMDADVTDPPYAFKASGGGHYRSNRTTMDEIVDQQLDVGFDQSIVNPLLCGAAVVFCHDDQLGTLLPYLDGSFHRRALCVWQKPAPQPVANKHYRPELEFYVHAWSRGFHPQGDMRAKLRLTVANGARGDEKHGHPTCKPDALMAKIVANVAGARICDPFMGTGSTGVAALRAGKAFIGIENNPAHFATAVARLRAVAA